MTRIGRYDSNRYSLVRMSALQKLFNGTDQQLDELTLGYRQDPYGEGEGRWMYLYWLKNTPAGDAEAAELPEERVEDFGVFYG